MSRLDAVAEHREYCPWINATSQGGGGGSNLGSHQIPSIANLAGWELLLRAINNNAQKFRRDAASDERSGADTSAADDNFSVDKEANEDPPPPPSTLGAGIGIEAISSEDAQAKELAARDEKDKERWAKLKRLKSVFHVKRGKGKLGGGEQRQVLTKRG